MEWEQANHRAAMAIGLLALASHGLEGYYKDLFVDAGAGVTSATALPAADTLGLDWERVSTGSRALTVRIMAGEPADSNGHLLYPDGSPRFRMMYVHGGHAVNHGDSLGPTGRQRIIDFYNGGGSYSGSCAGAIFATLATGTYERAEYNPSYLHIFPARTHYTQLADSYTDMMIPAASPLRKYYDYGGDGRVAEVRHNGGDYVIKGDDYYWAPGTEILATYANPVVGDSNHQDFLGNGSIWAYKTSAATGRLVLLGSHPEAVTGGERMRMFAGCLRYAMEGIGAPKVKGVLENGKLRIMGNNADPGYEKIGDQQYHHFLVEVPPGAEKLTVALAGEAGYDFGLYAAFGDFAFAGKAAYAADLSGPTQSLAIEKPKAGRWYVGVKLKTTVTVSKNAWGQEYTGKLPVLNGIAYTIQVQGAATAIGNRLAVSRLDARLRIPRAGNAGSLEIMAPVAGEYAFELRTLSGSIIGARKASLPAGFTGLNFHASPYTGSAIGVLHGPGESITRLWRLP
jgi:glutamine amidotransferase-like uncharacterized protein